MGLIRPPPQRASKWRTCMSTNIQNHIQMARTRSPRTRQLSRDLHRSRSSGFRKPRPRPHPHKMHWNNQPARNNDSLGSRNRRAIIQCHCVDRHALPRNRPQAEAEARGIGAPGHLRASVVDVLIRDEAAVAAGGGGGGESRVRSRDAGVWHGGFMACLPFEWWCAS